MVAGYSGPLFTLCRDDGATLAVSPQVVEDYLDYATINAWAGSSIPTFISRDSCYLTNWSSFDCTL